MMRTISQNSQILPWPIVRYSRPIWLSPRSTVMATCGPRDWAMAATSAALNLADQHLVYARPLEGFKKLSLSSSDGSPPLQFLPRFHGSLGKGA